MFGKRKKGWLTWDTLVPWIIGVGVLVIITIIILVLYSKDNSAISYLKTLLRFGK